MTPSPPAGAAHLRDMNLSVRSPEELVVAIPHLLGFNPTESLVLVPLAPELPVVRVDLPTSAREREQA